MPKATTELFASVLDSSQIKSSPVDLKVYGQDWSQVLSPNPALALFPKSTEEISKILKICNQNNIAVVPSGGRTGLSGGAVACNGEVVLSLAKMNRIETVDSMTRTVRVQAGAITQAVHDATKAFGLTWPVDFASKGSSQVGGNLSTNAGGVNVIRYGNTRNWVQSIEVVMMDGEILELNGELEKNNTGYDLRHLVIGAEGTLAVITAATLKLSPVVKEKSTYFFALNSMQEVAHLLASCRKFDLSLGAFEYLSQKSFLESLDFLKLPSPLSVEATKNAQAFVLIEALNADTNSEHLEKWFEEIFSTQLVIDGAQAQSSTQSEQMWSLRESVAESVMHKAEVYQHDVSVPVLKLVEFSKLIEEFYRSHYPHFEVFIFGHIGDGNLHIFIRRPLSQETQAFLSEVKHSDKELFKVVQQFHGSVSAEHGIGLLKKSALAFSRSAREIAIFQGIKRVFDPKGLLNPGKIIDL